MLERVTIHDFAVARDVTVAPGQGLNAFTGETGAGKSLIVDALAFLFGGRRGREVIAGGADRAVVEARLLLDGRALTVERTITLGGRATARVDGRAATLDELQALGARAVDIHGQSGQLAILRPAVQLAVLDAYAGLGVAREHAASLVRSLRDVRRRAQALATDARERERLIDQLRFEVDEIAAAGLEPGEDAALAAERLRLGSVARLLEDAALALDALDAPPVAEAVRASGDIIARDPSAQEVAGFAAALDNAAGDLRRALRRYRDALDEDPERLAAVEERLDRIARLRRKYGETVDDVIAYGRSAAERLAALTSSGQSLEALAADETRLAAELAPAAEALSRQRRGAAGRLAAAIAAELGELGMGGAALSVGFACEDDTAGVPVALPDYEIVGPEPPGGPEELQPRAFTESGVDRVEFLASFNAGESARPLASVASGGETSRFLLALTTVLGASAEPRTVVFDEVDEGVGGRAGALVGDALARLGERHQVLCITHLPQVAARAARHFVVTKQTDGRRTWSEIQEVAGDGRATELAAMLGGVTPATLATAHELLASSR